MNIFSFRRKVNYSYIINNIINMEKVVKLEGRVLRGLANLQLNIGDESGGIVNLMDLFPTIKTGVVLRSSLARLLDLYVKQKRYKLYGSFSQLQEDKSLQDILGNHIGKLWIFSVFSLVDNIFVEQLLKVDNIEKIKEEDGYIKLFWDVVDQTSYYSDGMYTLLHRLISSQSYCFDARTLINLLISHPKTNKLYANIAIGNIEEVKTLLLTCDPRGNNFLAYHLCRKRRNREIFNEIKHHTILRILLRNEVILQLTGMKELCSLFKIF